MKVCPFCASRIDIKLEVCPICGSDLRPDAEIKRLETNRRNVKALLIIAAATLFLFSTFAVMVQGTPEVGQTGKSTSAKFVRIERGSTLDEMRQLYDTESLSYRSFSKYFVRLSEPEPIFAANSTGAVDYEIVSHQEVTESGQTQDVYSVLLNAKEYSYEEVAAIANHVKELSSEKTPVTVKFWNNKEALNNQEAFSFNWDENGELTYYQNI
jgi:hypothetical protein